MIKEHFYFLTDDYCERYEQYRIMKNKEVSDGTIKTDHVFMQFKMKMTTIFIG